MKDTKPIPLGECGTPTALHLQQLTKCASIPRGLAQGARPKEGSIARTSDATGTMSAMPQLEASARASRPATPSYDKHGDELDYQDGLDLEDPDYPPGVNLDESTHSIHSFPCTLGHWEDDINATTVLEYSHSSPVMGTLVEPLIASTPGHLTVGLATPLIPASPASETLDVSVPLDKDILIGPMAEATIQEERALLGEATATGSPIEALNPGLQEAADFVPNLTLGGLDQLQAPIDMTRLRRRPAPPPGYSPTSAQSPSSGNTSSPLGPQSIFVRNLSQLGVDITGTGSAMSQASEDEVTEE